MANPFPQKKRPGILSGIGRFAKNALPILGPVGIAARGAINDADRRKQQRELLMTETDRRKEAMKNLPRILADARTPVPVESTAPGDVFMDPRTASQVARGRQRHVLETLGKAAPEATTESILNQVLPPPGSGRSPRKPAIVAEMEAAGLPITLENVKKWSQAKAAGNDLDPKKRLEIELLMQQLRAGQREAEGDQRELAEQEDTMVDTQESVYRELESMLGDYEQIEDNKVATTGTIFPAEPFANVMGSVTGALGMDETSEGFGKDEAALERIRKGSARIQALQQQLGQFATNTDASRRLIESISPSELARPQTNYKIAETMLTEALEGRTNKLPQGLRERYTALRRKYRGKMADSNTFPTKEEALRAADSGKLKSGAYFRIEGDSEIYRNNDG